MSGTIDPDELELTDSELLDVVRNHATGRRSVMAALGVGTLATLGTGTAAAKHDNPHPPHIDEYFGYSAPADERLPRKLRPDHEVELHVDPAAFSPVSETDMPFHFEPSGLAIERGAIVQFFFESPEHTVTAYHLAQGRQQRVPDDNVPFSSPVLAGEWVWLYRFDHPGTYDLFCAPHEFFAMVMRIVVGDPDGPDYDGVSSFGTTGRPPISRPELALLGVTSWPFPTPEEVLETEALEEDNIFNNGSIDHSDVEDDL